MDRNVKPFTPSEAITIVEHLKYPAVFSNMTADWPALHWTVEHLSCCLDKKALRFRIGKRLADRKPLFETQCMYVDATLNEFRSWTSGGKGPSIGAFCDYSLSDFWAYADYKYIAKLFPHNEDMFQEVVWSDFGYSGRNGSASTLWVGTNGANTPCHLDTYGYNLVLQVQGRKRWHLFPPSDTRCMYPTRIPYEESSVFSLVNVTQPDLIRFPAFRRARSHVVTLEPGQVLFVPRHWWHYVESVDPVTVSINSWIELEEDDEARIGEALTRTLVSALKTTPSQDNVPSADDWLNPTEDGVTSYDDNLQYLTLAMQSCLTKKTVIGQSDHQAMDNPPHQHPELKRDSSGRVKTSSHHKDRGKTSHFTLPFGPFLTAVPCLAQHHHKHEVPDLHKSSSSPVQGLNPCGPLTNQESIVDGIVHDKQDGNTLHLVEGSTPSTDEHGQNQSQTHLSSTSPLVTRGYDQSQAPLSTTDLLEALVHPEVISLVSQLLIDRQRELIDSCDNTNL